IGNRIPLPAPLPPLAGSFAGGRSNPPGAEVSGPWPPGEAAPRRGRAAASPRGAPPAGGHLRNGATVMRDFTRGPILAPLLAFAGPTIAGNLLQISYNLVDTLWIGRLGGDALAAVSVSLLLFTLLFSFSWGLSSSGTALVSQYFGAGRRHDLGRVSANLLLLFLAVSTVAAAAMLV